MHIACCAWALNLSADQQLRKMRELGFEWIDVQAGQLRSAADRMLAKQLGLTVSCLGASFDMPAGTSLDHESKASRRQAIQHVADALDHATNLGAGTVYLIPDNNTSQAALKRYGDSLCELADHASVKDIKLAVEHFPATALPTASMTLSFLRKCGHPNLYLLYDSGHIQISGEDPEQVILDAGDRLGYVHLDDNDGKNDLHWSLLDGVMTEETLVRTLDALDRIGYSGMMSLELHPKLPHLLGSLAGSRDILLRTGRSSR